MSLTHYTKVRSHTPKRVLLYVCTYTVSGSFSLLAGSFAFPLRYWFTIGQSEYLALEDIPHIQTGYHVLPYSSSQHVHFCTGCHPVSRAFQTLPSNTHTDSGLCYPSSFSKPLLGESLADFLLGYLDVSVPRFASTTYDPVNDSVCRNVSIRKSPVITVHITLPTLIAD